jgi:Methyltransferase domain
MHVIVRLMRHARIPRLVKSALQPLRGMLTLDSRLSKLELAVSKLAAQETAQTKEIPSRGSEASRPNSSFSIQTMLCQHQHFEKSWFRRWNQEVHPEAWFRQWNADVYQKVYPQGGLTSSSPKLHRKPWEWCAIAEALWERGFLEAGKTCAGFAVGSEPLPSLFAKYGVSVLATDLDPQHPDSVAWQVTNQHAASRDGLWKEEIVSQDLFRDRVRFQYADMKNVEAIEGTFDFVWSSCALEHLGSLEEGMEFVLASSKLLKPGGIGIHTTEFNVASNSSTLTGGPNVIYRKQDIEALDYRLRLQGKCLEEMDFRAGVAPDDRLYDIPPYYLEGRQHIKLLLEDHVSTSIVFIVYA